MTKKEACHALADINEKISELEDLLIDVEYRLRLDDKSRKDWYIKQKANLLAKLEIYKHKHDEFIKEYHDVIYS